MIVQIYETQNAEEAVCLVEAGVDHVGVLVGHGEFPREIPPGQARGILCGVDGRARKVVLTLSGNPGDIAAIVDTTDPDILHLGTTPDSIVPDDLDFLKQRFPNLDLMRSIPVLNEASVVLARHYDGIADYLLLDTQMPGEPQIGATGRIHDWKLSRTIVEAVGIPVILAGGLGPDNVADAVRRVKPAGVDSKTGTDCPGSHNKDLDKVRRFVRIAKAVE